MPWLARVARTASGALLVGALAGCADDHDPTIAVSPPSATLAQGQKLQLVVTRQFPGGPIEVVTDRMTYWSTNAAVGAISAGGEISAQGIGTVVIHVADRDTRGVSAASFVITPP